jgi:TRAP-type C4-dicarboxylate transport system permease small subunit
MSANAVGIGPSHPAEVAPEELVASFAEADTHDVDLSGHTVEDWICFGFFWIMAMLVFIQFFTRYVMNDSFAWTEELAVYCLIPVVFIGSAACVRRSRHIQVNILYRYLPKLPARVLSTFVDRNKSHVYWLAFAGFALMFLRSLQVSWIHWQQGYSILERPEAYDGVED